MIQLLFIVTIGLLCANNVRAQEEHFVHATVIDGDTVPKVWLNTVYVSETRAFKSNRARKKYNHLKYHVKKVYPYAKMAGNLYHKYQDSLSLAASDRQRKKFYKLMEDELRAEYEEDLKKMGMTQGRILIKLIDREIGQTSFHVVKDLRNGLTAFVFQSLAKIFGHDLKAQYDPTGEDRVIEDIVVAIERGYIKLE